MSTEKTEPMYAEVVSANDAGTVAALVLFDRRVERTFTGPRHLHRAQAWVQQWEVTLAAGWDTVRNTTATIMDAFTGGLERRGVDKRVIMGALEEIGNGK